MAISCTKSSSKPYFIFKYMAGTLKLKLTVSWLLQQKENPGLLVLHYPTRQSGCQDDSKIELRYGPPCPLKKRYCWVAKPTHLLAVPIWCSQHSQTIPHFMASITFQWKRSASNELPCLLERKCCDPGPKSLWASCNCLRRSSIEPYVWKRERNRFRQNYITYVSDIVKIITFCYRWRV